MVRKRPPNSARHRVEIVRWAEYQLHVIGALARRVYYLLQGEKSRLDRFIHGRSAPDVMAAMTEMAAVTTAPGSNHQRRHCITENPPIKKHCAWIIADRTENTRWMTTTLLNGFEMLSALLVWMNLGCLHCSGA